LLIVDDNTWKRKERARDKSRANNKFIIKVISSFRRQMRVIKELIKITSAGSRIFSEVVRR